MFRTIASRVLLFLTLSLSPGPTATGAQTDWAEVHAKTIRGIDHIYHLDFEAATETFDSVQHMAPRDPRGHFFGSMVIFWRYTMTQDKNDYEAFLTTSDRVVETCESILDDHENDNNAKFFLGGILGYRGMAHQMDGSILKAVRDGRQGYMHLEDAVRSDTSLYDAQMGFGLFQYLLAKIPRSFRWVLTMLGFEGNAAEGLRLLKAAADHGLYARTEAAFFLSSFLFSEGKHDEAFTYLRPLLERYPDNAVFLSLAAGWYQRLNRTDEALATAYRAIEVSQTKRVHYGEEYAYGLIGNIAFGRNDFARARDAFRLSVERSRSAARISNQMLYRLGVCQEILGDRPAALESYKRMRPSSDQDRPSDTYFYRRGQELLARALTRAEILIVQGGNLAGTKQYGAVDSLYRAALSLAGNDRELQSRAVASLQQSAFDQGKADDVRTLTGQLQRLHPDRERWLLPQALLRLAQTLAKEGKSAEALETLEEIDEYDDYDYQVWIEARAEEEKARLRGK
jgi:tetratricopeptide (TPR) repeat protein